jgi:hypothetical protein
MPVPIGVQERCLINLGTRPSEQCLVCLIVDVRQIFGSHSKDGLADNLLFGQTHKLFVSRVAAAEYALPVFVKDRDGDGIK